MEGKFITLEGIEGSGKSTSLETISKKLTEEKIDFVVTKEPGGGPLGPPLRNLLLNKDAKISPQVELILMIADRKNHLAEVAHTFLLVFGFWCLLQPFWGQEGFGNDAEP